MFKILDKNIWQILLKKYKAIATSFTLHRVQLILTIRITLNWTNYIHPNNYDIDSNSMNDILSYTDKAT